MRNSKSKTKTYNIECSMFNFQLGNSTEPRVAGRSLRMSTAIGVMLRSGILLAFLLLPSQILADGQKNEEIVLKPMNSGMAYSRLCEERDLRGLWRVVKWTPYMEVKGADWRLPMFLRHQWMEFDGSGHLRTVAANKKISDGEAEKLLRKALWKLTITFKRLGFCVISSEKARYPGAVWRCALITKEIKSSPTKLDLKKGDVVMTLLGDDENILYFRQLRKIKLTAGKSE